VDGNAVRKILIAILAFFIIVPVVAVGVGYISYQSISTRGPLPAEKPQPEAGTSYIYAADGSLIGSFKGAETRTVVPIGEISEPMKIATVAAEDRNFYKHKGVDLPSIVRAGWQNLTDKEITQGGSTITQQLAKNVYTSGDKTFNRKAKETVIAAQLEKHFTKDEILTKYLNTVYFGDSAYGVEAAAQSYFRKPAKELTLSESALLAGVLPAPSEYSPRSHPQVAEQRRQLVLNQIEEYKLAPKEEVDKARAESPTIHPPPDTVGPYPFFQDYVRIYLLSKGYSPELIYNGGLRIETTLDPRLQAKGQEVLKKTLPEEKDPDAALVSIEPSTGFVRTLVGGTDWNQSKVNLALGHLGGGSGRQAGSAFKPFVLTRAYEVGVKPEKVYPAPPTVQPRGFTKPVGNYEGGSFGSANLNKGMASSINTVFAQLIADVGVHQTAETAVKLGITSLDLTKPIYPTLSIGAYEVSPLDMASAYGTFATGGLRQIPTPILRLIDREGNVIEDNTQRQATRVMDENVANNVTKTLTGVVTGGTGTAARLDRPVAGKTGTSDKYQNAWFVGYTPQLSTAVWMGYKESNNISLYNVRGVSRVTGGSHPARMWKEFMVEAVKDTPVMQFPAAGPIKPVGL
jgi:penicillin-binding protein 1A